MSDLKKLYTDLHEKYLLVSGVEFDATDIDQASISYAYNTCGVEGNTISLGETERIIISDKVIEGKSLREHIEIKNAHEAFCRMFDFIKGGFEMNEALAMTFHRLNTKGWLKEEWSGQYKTIVNRVGGKSTPYPEKAKDLFRRLFVHLEQEKDPFNRASKLHLDTVLIHPWQDGNGRTARLMMNFELLKNGHGHLQIAKSEKEGYFQAIRESERIKSLDPFLNYLYGVGISTYRKKIEFLSSGNNPNKSGERAWDYGHEVSFYGT